MAARLRVREDQLTLFYRRLATMVGAGITIDRALDFLQQSEDPNLTLVIEEVLAGILEGRSLSASMRLPEFAGVFSPVAIGLVTVGENTGSILDSLSRLADLSERNVKLRRMVVAALTYPALLAAAILAVALLFVLILGPGDQGLFSLFGGKLPWPTRVMVALSAALRDPLVVVTGVGGMALLAWTLHGTVQRVPAARYALDRLLLRLPCVGDVIRKMAASRMLHVLATSIQVGVPVTEALVMARTVAVNRVLADRLDRATRMFREGAELGEALERTGAFPRLVTIIMNVGQETGQLDPMLARLSTLYEEEVEASLTTLARLLEPILLAVAGAVAMFVCVATMLPVVQFVNRI